MPSKTKIRRRERRLEEQGWFTLTEDLWRSPGEVLPKLRLIADANFSSHLVKLMRQRNIVVRTAQDLQFEKLEDHELLRRVTASRCVLITMDQDFWSDRKFPLHLWGGLIYIDSRSMRFGVTLGFDLLTEFLASFGGGWDRLKIKASADKLHMKLISIQNNRVLYEVRVQHGAVFAREADDSEV
ncbi:MAG TPA: DUF5615 family PIN-like protein [Terriglobia bacterium]|nr:DUF5615 family PIN-like protein [Terriglobia bacterium]